MRYFVGDIRDRDRLQTALRDVDIVVHAAAMKHVPICEYNPIEAVQTNVHGARNVIEAALSCGVQRVIALSSADLDVTDEDAVTRVFGELGPVDVLVNNAGVSSSAPLARTPLAESS